MASYIPIPPLWSNAQNAGLMPEFLAQNRQTCSKTSTKTSNKSKCMYICIGLYDHHCYLSYIVIIIILCNYYYDLLLLIERRLRTINGHMGRP